MNDNIGDRIKEIMTLVKMNQKTFAEKINITDTSLRKWTNGETQPSYSHLFMIIKTFPEINALWLLTGEDTIMNSRNNLYSPERNINMTVNDKENKYKPHICSDCPFKCVLQNLEAQINELKEQISSLNKP